jgi:1-deoxy-D-xylulose-5-phosphate reductoisomerase
MVQNITILGSTGSIGTQTLQVIDHFQDRFKVMGLSTRGNIDLLETQIRKYKPLAVAVLEEEKAFQLGNRIKDLKTSVLSGEDGLHLLSTWPDVELVVIALVGFSGLRPTLAALKDNKKVALANKEALVVGGELIMAEARARNITILPIDSEHSAIFQCLQSGHSDEVSRIILTASGGPFLGWEKERLADVTPAQALKHPNWKMGDKITIDSATLMNKGFEVIEARWLFNLDFKQIEVVIHPESIVHSMVEYKDGSTIAQMGLPDMLLPIQYALSYPKRWENTFPRFQWDKSHVLNFIPPNRNNFPCLYYAYNAGEIGGTMPAVLNAANEVAVEHFLNSSILFPQISALLEEIMGRHNVKLNPTLQDISAADNWAREETRIVMQKFKGEC